MVGAGTATGPDDGIVLHLAREDVVDWLSPSSLTASQFTGQQTLDGAPVDVVQSPDGPTTYIDAQSYIVGEWTGGDRPPSAPHA